MVPSVSAFERSTDDVVAIAAVNFAEVVAFDMNYIISPPSIDVVVMVVLLIGIDGVDIIGGCEVLWTVRNDRRVGLIIAARNEIIW